MGAIRSSSACQGKIPYDSRREAAHVIRTMTKKPGNVKPYRCPLCGKWHVGHNINKQKANLPDHLKRRRDNGDAM